MSALTYTATKGLKHIGTEVGSWLADTTAEVVTGAELVSGWTNNVGHPYETFTQSAVDITSAINTTAYGICYSAITLTAGKRYTVSFDLTLNSGTAPSFRISTDSSLNTGLTVLDGAANGIVHYSFVAGSETYIGLRVESGVATNFSVASFSMRLSDEDLSTTAHDLAYYGSITKSAVATGSTVMAYSGFSASNYLAHQAYEAATDLTSALTACIWFKTTNTGNHAMVANYETGTDDGGFLVQIETGTIRLYVRDNAGVNVGSLTTGVYNDGNWHLFIGTLSGGTITNYIDGVIDGTVGSATLDATNTTIHIGNRPDLSVPFTSGSLSLVRVLSTALTATQVKTIYDAEKHMFKANSVFTQVGEDYSLDVDMPVVNRSEKSISNKTISLGGNQETVFQRSDVMHNITIGPTHKNGMPELRTFLQSVNAGETFTFDPYGTVASPDDPISVVTDGGHNESRQNGTNYFNISMKLREV